MQYLSQAAQSVQSGASGSARPLARPAFGSSPSLLVSRPLSLVVFSLDSWQGLPDCSFMSSVTFKRAQVPCLDVQTLDLEDHAAESASDYSGVGDAHFYEVTIGSVDQPKLLSRLTDALVRLMQTPSQSALSFRQMTPCMLVCPLSTSSFTRLNSVQGDLDLNICEAHAFTTTDKFSLDVFVVNGWQGEVRSLPTSAFRSFAVTAPVLQRQHAQTIQMRDASAQHSPTSCQPLRRDFHLHIGIVEYRAARSSRVC